MTHSHSYIYGLTDPITGSVRYVGRTNNLKKRYVKHLNPSMNEAHLPRADWIRGLMAQGELPGMTILKYVIHEDPCMVERRVICALMATTPDLLNISASGHHGTRKKCEPGCTCPKHKNRFPEPTPEYRAKLSAGARARVRTTKCDCGSCKTCKKRIYMRRYRESSGLRARRSFRTNRSM